MAHQAQGVARPRRPLLAAVLGAGAGVALLALCVRFFRAAQGVFGEQQKAQRVIVVIVTLLSAGLALGVLALAAMSFVSRRRREDIAKDPQPPAAS
jgi:hypothetical protein